MKGLEDEEAPADDGRALGRRRPGDLVLERRAAPRIAYRTIAVRRGDLRSTINATGTIEPEQVVEVGAQVAGQVQSFGTDPRDPKKPVSYGTHVEPGSVLARLDDALFRRGWTRRGAAWPAPRPTSTRPSPSSAMPSANGTGRGSSGPNAAMVAVQEYDTA